MNNERIQWRKVEKKKEVEQEEVEEEQKKMENKEYKQQLRVRGCEDTAAKQNKCSPKGVGQEGSQREEQKESWRKKIDRVFLASLVLALGAYTLLMPKCRVAMSS